MTRLGVEDLNVVERVTVASVRVAPLGHDIGVKSKRGAVACAHVEGPSIVVVALRCHRVVWVTEDIDAGALSMRKFQRSIGSGLV